MLNFHPFTTSIGDSSESLSISISLARHTLHLNYLVCCFYKLGSNSGLKPLLMFSTQTCKDLHFFVFVTILCLICSAMYQMKKPPYFKLLGHVLGAFEILNLLIKVFFHMA